MVIYNDQSYNMICIPFVKDYDVLKRNHYSTNANRLLPLKKENPTLKRAVAYKGLETSFA